MSEDPSSKVVTSELSLVETAVAVMSFLLLHGYLSTK